MASAGCAVASDTDDSALFPRSQGQIPFVTLRNMTERDGAKAEFGDGRGTLRAGWCHTSARQIPILNKAQDTVEFRVPDEWMTVEKVTTGPLPEMLAQYREALVDAEPVLYIHGYNIGFDKGCRRATLLKENAGLGQSFLWFSWPSDGSLLNYAADEADIAWSVPELSDLIIEMTEVFADRRVHIIGHSLGARGLTYAMTDVALRAPEARLGHVVWAAADIDFEIFAKLLPRFSSHAESLSVYTSDTDRPLALSKQLHGYTRLGQAENDWTRLKGAEVIDKRDLPTRSPTGHLYHLHDEVVGRDMRALIMEGRTAAERDGLEQVGPNHWILKPSE